MEAYDFTGTSIRDDLEMELDALSPKDLKAVQGAVREIQAERNREQAQSMETWFDQAVLPILKEFANEHFAVLEIERSQGVITATLRSDYFEIGGNHRCMRFLLAAATHIIIDQKDGKSILALVYDCERQPLRGFVWMDRGGGKIAKDRKREKST